MSNETSTTLGFAIDDQNMWGSGQSLGIDRTFNQLQWHPSTSGAISAGPVALQYSLSGTIGPSFSVSYNGGSVDVSYPVRVDVETPSSVQTGSNFVIDTSGWQVANGSLISSGPAVHAEADLDFD